MGYRGSVPYHGMVWDIGLRSHTIADMVWVLNGISHWDPIGILFLEGYCSGAIMGAIFGSHVWESYLGVTLRSYNGYNDD